MDSRMKKIVVSFTKNYTVIAVILKNVLVSLTDSSKVFLDKYGKSELKKEGMLSVSIGEKWMPLCENNSSNIDLKNSAEEICEYLGFQ